MRFRITSSEQQLVHDVPLQTAPCELVGADTRETGPEEVQSPPSGGIESDTKHDLHRSVQDNKI